MDAPAERLLIAAAAARVGAGRRGAVPGGQLDRAGPRCSGPRLQVGRDALTLVACGAEPRAVPRRSGSDSGGRRGACAVRDGGVGFRAGARRDLCRDARAQHAVRARRPAAARVGPDRAGRGLGRRSQLARAAGDGPLLGRRPERRLPRRERPGGRPARRSGRRSAGSADAARRSTCGGAATRPDRRLRGDDAGGGAPERGARSVEPRGRADKGPAGSGPRRRGPGPRWHPRRVVADLEGSQRRGDPLEHVVLLYLLASVDDVQGRYQEARALLQRTLDLLADGDPHQLALSALVLLAIAHASLGDARLARQALDGIEAELANKPGLHLQARAGGGLRVRPHRGGRRSLLHGSRAVPRPRCEVWRRRLRRRGSAARRTAGRCRRRSVASRLEALAADAQDEVLQLRARHARSVANRDADAEVELLEKAQNAEFWIAPGDFSSLKEMTDSNPHYSEFASFQNKKVYSYGVNKGAKGGILYFELSPTRPDLVLKDLLKIFHPELLPDYKPYFFQRLE